MDTPRSTSCGYERARGLQQALGWYTLYDEVTAVSYCNFYELDLLNPHVRWVKGQIKLLVISEPGEKNIILEHGGEEMHNSGISC
jgi:hypothetical protein